LKNDFSHVNDRLIKPFPIRTPILVFSWVCEKRTKSKLHFGIAAGKTRKGPGYRGLKCKIEKGILFYSLKRKEKLKIS